MKICATIVTLLISAAAFGQTYRLEGRVTRADTAVEGAQIVLPDQNIQRLTDANGRYKIEGLKEGPVTVVLFYFGYQTETRQIRLSSDVNLDFNMTEISQTLDELVIEDMSASSSNIGRLAPLKGFGIYDAKKTEVITPDEMAANLAANNSRQIFGKAPGLNIWENDYAGLQLAIGARGLDPNRTSNFNVRQNGYDISADALGYPESYYTPPAEAIETIEIVRGASSLQYGTHFGGLLNFILKKGPSHKKVALTSRQTIGSYGFINSFNSLGGQVGNFNYYTFYQHKQGDGWRDNSKFDLDMAYAHLEYSVTPKLTMTGQFTYMRYLAKQPGGLTDFHFNEDPRQSIRDRNWFRVNWNLWSLSADYRFNDRLKLNIRNFGLLGSRDALGNLERIDRADDGGRRNLFADDFTNFGHESRLVYTYNTHKNPMALLVGFRFYDGFTHRRQGYGPEGDAADFSFFPAKQPGVSVYDFPGKNLALFAENIFSLGKKWSLTPGFRIEHIVTRANGFYYDKVLVPDPETGFARDSLFQVNERKENPRTFVFGGLGLSYKHSENLEFYGNLSQNFRSINFNDIRSANENVIVDPKIRDEKGYNLDIGVRGSQPGFYNFDVSLFLLRYKNRIGNALQTDDNFRVYRFRTNTGNSRHWGIEAFGQLNLLHFAEARETELNLYANFSYIDAEYIESHASAIEGKHVELTPPVTVRTGVEGRYRDFRATFQYSFIAEQYSDATNAVRTSSAVEGIIPSYQVMDLSLSYKPGVLIFEGGINNLVNAKYFTRRASGYPGPGIIPSDGRNFYLTAGVKL